ncbi:MAG TPA: hypothetical protein VMW73_00590 [Spirochaetia bacterium]|nr:hypothetical protein [Spirochaetia bacterium]
MNYAASLLALFAAVLIPGTAVAQTGITWYHSDSLGFLFKPLVPQPEDASALPDGYVAGVQKSAGEQALALYSDRVLDQRTVTKFGTDGTREATTVYRGTDLFHETRYSKSGDVISETYYADGLPATRTTFEYAGGLPLSATTYTFTRSADGAEVATPAWKDSYSYYPGSSGADGKLAGPSVTGHTAAGALREVTRTYTDGRIRVSRYDYSGTRVTEEWQGGESTGILNRYDSRGRTSARENWSAGKLLSREQFVYNSHDQLVSSHLENMSSGEVTDRQYEAGKVTEEKLLQKGVLASTSTFQYEQGRLISSTMHEGRKVDRYTYTYDASGKKETESHYLDGELVEVIHYTTGGSYTERYRNGKLVLRTYYEGERRTREELIRDGKVVRELAF